MQSKESENPQCKSLLGRKIILPIDNSANVHHAFDWFFKYGYRKTDHIVFVHVVQPVFAHNEINIEGTSYNTKEEMSVNFDEGKKIEEKYSKLAKEAHVNFSTTCLAECEIGEAILALAEKEKANMIVIGYPPNPGSTLAELTHYLVGYTKIPILVVPPED